MTHGYLGGPRGVPFDDSGARNEGGSMLARIFRERDWQDCCIDLCRALQRNDRKVSLAVVEVDPECKSIAGLSGHKRSRSCARRASRPSFSWFEAR